MYLGINERNELGYFIGNDTVLLDELNMVTMWNIF